MVCTTSLPHQFAFVRSDQKKSGFGADVAELFLADVEVLLNGYYSRWRNCKTVVVGNTKNCFP
jgi:hypothetical protein